MTHEIAIAVSGDLLEAGFSHTLSVGIHENLRPAVNCSVDLALPNRYDGTLSEAVSVLEQIANRHEMQLVSSLLSGGLSFQTPRPGGGVV
jgi:hypothetical protein